jgi:hypothetical protein
VLIVAVVIFGGVALAQRGGSGNTANTAVEPSGVAQTLGQRTKTEGCTVGGGLPDGACTPGAILPDATKEQICVPGYSAKVRNVPESEKVAVYAEYGIRSHKAGQYEVDHLISLELGGSNDISNLWPEAAEPRPGYHEKDRYENFVHGQVCRGEITLQEAQRRISENWLQNWIAAGKP